MIEQKINPLTGLPFGETSKTDPKKESNGTTNINPLTGKPFGSNEFSPNSFSTAIPNMHEQIRLLGDDASVFRTDASAEFAIAQKPGEEVIRGLGNFGKNFAAGFLDAVGVLDPTLASAQIAGVDAEYDDASQNAFTKVADQLRNSAKPIYLEAPDTFNPSDTAWWSDIFAQTGTSVGIMAEALVETVATTYLTGGLGTIPSTIKNVAKVASLFPKLSKANKLRNTAMKWAAFRRYSESLIEAKDNGLRTYEEYRTKGMSDKEASKQAGRVASKTFQGNLPLMVFDIVTAGLLTKYNPVTGKTTQVLDKIKPKNNLLNKFLTAGVIGVSEGSEELWQEWVNENSKYIIDRENGFVRHKQNRGEEYLKSGKAWNAFASGVFGAGFLGGISKGLNSLSGDNTDRNFDIQYDEYLNNQINLAADISKEIQNNSDNKNKVESLRRKLGVSKALTALHMDQKKGTNEAFTGYLDFLSKIEETETEDLPSMGIENEAFISEVLPDLQKDAVTIKSIYDQEKQFTDPNVLLEVVERRYTLDIINQEKTKTNQQLSELNNSVEVSSEEKFYTDLQLSKKALEKNIKELSGKLGEVAEDTQEWTETRELINAKEQKLVNINQEITDLKKPYSTNLLPVDQILVLKEKQEVLNSATMEISKQVSVLKSKEVQDKIKENQKKSKIENAQTKEELELIEKQEDLTQKEQDRIKVKKHEKEAAQVIEQEDIFKVEPEKKKIIEDIESLFGEEPEITLDPIIINRDKITPQSNEKLKNSIANYYNIISRNIPNPSFEDMVSDYIQEKGIENADRLYNGFKLGWQANNYPETNFDKVYDRLFLNKADVIKGIESIIEETISKQQKDLSTNKILNQDNNVSEEPLGLKRVDSKLAFAFISVPYKTAGGQKEDASKTLFRGTEVDSSPLMNPNTFLSGEVYKVRIANDYNEIKISGEKGSVKFGTWVSSNNIQEGSEEWIKRLPLQILNKDGSPVAYIQDYNWYKPSNIGYENKPLLQEELIKEAQEELLEFRKNFLESDTVEIEVTEKSGGKFNYLEGNTTVPIKDMSPDSLIAIVTDSGFKIQGSISEGEKGITIENKDFHITQSKVGTTLELRKLYGNTYRAFNISANAKPEVESIKQAIKTFVFKNDVGTETENTRRQVIDKTGLDLYNVRDLHNYLHMLIKTSGSPEFVQRNNKYKEGMAWLTTQDGQVVFGEKGKKYGKFPYLFLNPNLTGSQLEATKNTFSQLEGHIEKLFINVDITSAGDNLSLGRKERNIVTIDNNGNVFDKGKYSDYLKGVLHTNTISYNVGTNENPIYAVAVQPNIRFKLKGKVEGVKTPNINTTVEKSTEVVDTTDNRQVYIDAYKTGINLGMNPSSPEMTYLKNLIGESEDLFDSVVINDVTNIIPNRNISYDQEFEITNFISNKIIIEVNNNELVNQKSLMENIKQGYFSLIKDSQESADKTITNLENLYNSNKSLNANLLPVIDSLKSKVEIFNSIKQEWDKIAEDTLQKIKSSRGIKEIDDLSYNEETEERYSKISLEDSGKKSTSKNLKKFLTGIPIIKKNGTLSTGFLGVPLFHPYDYVYDTIGKILSSPTEISSDYNLIIQRLSDNIENYPWLSYVIESLENSDQNSKNEFVYNFHRHSLSMKYVAFSKVKEGRYSLKVYDTNSFEINNVIIGRWRNNMLSTSTNLIRSEEGRYTVNKKEAQRLLDEFSTWKDFNKISNSTFSKWLNNFGIQLSNETLSELKYKKLKYYSSTGTEELDFDNLFRNSPNTAGIFGLLANYLTNIVQEDNLYLNSKPSNNPYNNINNALKTIARIESKYTLFTATNSFRDGGKTIFGYTPTKWATDSTLKLRQSKEYRQQLKEKDFNSNSYILEMLNNNELFRDKYYTEHLGITSIKELGKKVFGDNSIANLSDIDLEYLSVGLLQDREQGETAYKYNGFDMIMARTLFPTMSDKSQMLLSYSALFDFKPKDFVLQEDKIVLSDSVLELLYSQLIEPELKRAVNSSTTDIKNYDKVSKLFLGVPSINLLKKRGTNISIIDFITEGKNQEEIENEFKNDIKKELQKLVSNLTNEKLKIWNQHFDIKGKDILDKNYFNSKQFPQKYKFEYAVNDFVVNNLISNANIQMLHIGDPALYFKGNIDGLFTEGNISLPINDDVYNQISRITANNMGKRLALLLAPGNKLADSRGDYYTQLFLEDASDISENIEYLIDLFYGKDSLNESKSLLKNKNIEELQKKFPLIADYFEIESTDAQEYTTIKEHLDILYRQGRLNEKDYNTFIEKYNKGEDFNFSELGIITQPIKPVYSGFVNDKINNIMRTMYIKSSSFPLLPQLTKGKEIDGLRRLMEDHEKSTGNNVRASYQSANKVGANANPLKIFNQDGKFNTRLKISDLETNSLLLDRENFRIQQEVPFKEGNEIKMGTQLVKLIWGDGAIDAVGEDTYREFNSKFIELTELKRNQLLERLGQSKEDSKERIQEVYKILKEEALDRNYPIKDIESLDLVPIRNKEGTIVDYKFKLPIWLSPNSNRYESLLNAIVSNSIIKAKFPGRSYVAGSETGFQTIDNLTKEDLDSIVYTSKWKGNLKAKGENNLAQVLMPSYFKDNKGNKIEFIYTDGSINKTYVEKTDQGYILQEDKIDSKLLNFTSFRIPTSSHVSMSQVEVVGFLPPSMGDLIILPKNFTKQKGLDFDVDKEYLNMLHTYVDTNGNIKLEKDNIKKVLENDIVQIISKVYSHPDMQSKINRVLSMDDAKGQAEVIDNLQHKNKDFSFYSDQYQKDKLYLGSSGKSGIGVYSQYVTLNSLLQQATKDKPITLLDTEGKITTLKVGSLEFKGRFGEINTLDKGRTISQVFEERQNTATDNETEQIMGRLNINNNTIGVDSLLSLMGFDKVDVKDTKMSLPYLLLNQPIIKEYVKELRNAKSITKGFEINLEDKIIEGLLSKYSIEGDQTDYTILTGNSLFNQIGIEKPDSVIQHNTLKLFKEVKDMAFKISKLQNFVGITSRGLGKSFYDVINEYGKLDNFKAFKRELSLDNIDSLFGDVKEIETLIEVDSLIKQGYVSVGNRTFIKPTTPTGATILYGVTTAYDLWNEYIPFDSPKFSSNIESVMLELNEPKSDNKKIEKKQKITQEFKKYLFASNNNRLFTDSPQEERQRLFIDSNNNTSLASYLYDLIFVKQNSVIKNNPLINSFEYSLNSNGEPSLIKYNNAQADLFQEEHLYNSMASLIEEDIELPALNGKPYSTRKLVADLTSYSYLEGGIQEAIQFNKYIDTAYLEETGFSNFYRRWTSSSMTLFTNSFTDQFFQHNPFEAIKTFEEDIETIDYDGSKNLDDLLSFFKKDTKTNYLTIYNNKTNKPQLYKDNGSGIFIRMNLLGTFGMTEYQPREPIAKSIVNKNYNTSEQTIESPKINIQPNYPKEDTFNIISGNIFEIIDNIQNYEFSEFKYVKDLLNQFKDLIPKGTKLSIEDIVNDEGNRIANGKYNPETGITIDKEFLYNLNEGNEQVARTLLKEVIHSLTYNYMKQYVDKKGKAKVDNVPQEITNLIILFNEARSKFKDEIIQYRGTPSTAREKSLIYGLTNIYEFVETIMTEPLMQKELNQKSYKATNQSLLTRFAEVLNRLLTKLIGGNITNDSITANSILETIKIIEKANIEKPSDNVELKRDVKSEVLIKEIIKKSEDSFDIVIEEDLTVDLINQLEKRNCK